MTTIYETIDGLWKKALKERDPKKDTFSLIKTEIKNKVISTRTSGSGEIVPDDNVAIEVLKKMAKQRKESIAEYEKAGRIDLAEKEFNELGVIESFLPKQLTQAELSEIVKAAVAETGSATIKDLGKAMKVAMGKVAGRADGKDVQVAVKAALGGS